MSLVYCSYCSKQTVIFFPPGPLQWRHDGHDGVSNHQPHHCLLNRLFWRRSKKTSKLCVTGLCEGNSSGTGEFPAQMASNAENISIWWRHHVTINSWVTPEAVIHCGLFLDQEGMSPWFNDSLNLIQVRQTRFTDQVTISCRLLWPI